MQPIPFKDRENSPLRTKFFEIRGWKHRGLCNDTGGCPLERRYRKLHHGRDHQDVQGARNYGPVCAEPGFHPVSRQREDGEGGPTMKLEEAIAKAKILNDSLKELTDEYEGQGSFIAAGMAVSFKLVLDTILTALSSVSKVQV